MPLWWNRKPASDLAERVSALSGEVDALRSEIARQRGVLAEWEVTMTGLTDKLSRQLKRMGQRERDQANGEEEELGQLGPLSAAEFNRLR